MRRFNIKGRHKQLKQVKIKLVNNGWYLGVQFYERTLPSSDDTFQLSAQEMRIDAEGVIFSSSSLLLEPVRPEHVLARAPGTLCC